LLYSSFNLKVAVIRHDRDGAPKLKNFYLQIKSLICDSYS